MTPAVMLVPHNPLWAAECRAEAARIRQANAALELHHIGSTAIGGIAAKPVLDLLGIAADLEGLDAARPALEGIGYVWRGEFGLAGRRYCTLTDSAGVRRIQLHGYADGDPSIRRHLAFRDHLRARPALAAAYERTKRRCAALHPDDGRAYGLCKSAWIDQVEAEALRACAK